MSDHERFVRRTKDKFGRAHDDIFIGAVDWSYNEHKEGRHKPYWCVHFHGVTVTNDTEALKQSLGKQFPRSKTIRRPIKVEDWDGELAGIRYLMKPLPKRDRRISTDHGRRFDKKTGEYRKCRDTDHQPLKSKDKLELLLHLDTIGIAGRLLLKNVQFINLKDTGPTFVDRQLKARSRKNEGKGQLSQ